MKILEVLADTELSDKKKLKAITGMVSDIRAKYGNEEDETDVVKVNTTEGARALNLLTTDEKVAVAGGRLKAIIQEATAGAESAKGSKFDRIFECIVAVDPILTNLDMKSDSKY